MMSIFNVNLVEHSCVSVFLASVWFNTLHFYSHLKELFIFFLCVEGEAHSTRKDFWMC